MNISKPIIVLLLSFVSSGCTPPEEERPEAAVASAVAPTPSTPTETWRDPNAACAFLSAEGLVTKPYRDYGGEAWCMASLFFAESAPIPNEISYTASGDASRIKELVVGAETYNHISSEDRRTIASASDIAKALLGRILPDSTPSAPIDALRAGKTGTWKYGSTTVEVTRTEHQPGRGYRMALHVR